ncbi:MAG: FMN-binding protein, partial [bacterium]
SGDGGNNIISNIINSVVGPDDSVSAPAKTTTTKKTTTVKTTPVVTKSTSAPVQQQGQYKNGTYTGDSSDAYYGNVQVQAVIKNGALSNIVVLDYPQDRSTSVAKNTRAMPILVSEAIQAQSANVNTVSGATYSSGAFKQSLSSALSQAVN